MKEHGKWGFRYQWEYSEGGILIESGPPVCNLIPQAGVDHLRGLLRGTATPISNWYLGLFSGNYVPGDMGVTAADLPVNVGEFTAYEGASRLDWEHADEGVSEVGNSSNRAEFIFTGSGTVRGGFLISSSTKGGNTGLLMSIVRFPNPRPVEPGGILRVLAGVVFIPTTVA